MSSLGKIKSKLILPFFAMVFIPSGLEAQSPPTIPVWDLSFVDWQGETLSLDDQWAFAWKHFLDPLELEGDWARLGPEQKGLLAPRVRWDTLEGHIPGIENRGFGSYAVVLRVGDTQEPLALRLSPLSSASRIFVNGRLAWEAGEPSSDPDQATPHWQGTYFPIEDDEGLITLVVHSSNYEDLNPGLSQVPRISGLERIQTSFQRSLVAEYFTSGIFTIIGIHFLMVFAYRKRERAPLWFSLICFVLAIRVLVTGDNHIYNGSIFFPSYRLQMILSYVTLTAMVGGFIRYLTSLFSTRINSLLKRIDLVVSGGFTIIVLVTSPRFFMSLLTGYQLYIVAIGMGALAVMVMAMAQKYRSARLFTFALSILLGAMVHDILKIQMLFPTPFLVPTAVVLFVVVQTLLLSQRSSQALAETEEIRDHLSILNQAMERFIPREFITYLDKAHIHEVLLGDSSEQEMAVMFADIRGFTRISESLSPKETFDLLNLFLNSMGPVIREHHGFVDKYLGDGVMAIFPGGPADATAAAVAMVEQLPGLNRLTASICDSAIDIGAGIHHGKLMLGTVGEPQRIDTTVIADAVNLASRLQGLTRLLGSHVLITAESMIQHPLSRSHQTRPLGNFKVYNRDQKVDVIEVLDAEVSGLKDLKLAHKPALEQFFALPESERGGAGVQILEAVGDGADEDPGLQYWLELARNIHR